MAPHPLTPFIVGDASAPYHTADLRGWRDRFEWQTRVVAVNCTTGLARPRRAGARYVHRVESMAGVFQNGALQLAARWLCRNHGTENAVVVTDAAGYELCPRCEDAYIGPAVYRCFSADGRLLYVGAARSLAYRLRQHELGTPWWPLVARVDDERFSNIDAALDAETKAIETESPVYNRTSRPVGRQVS